MDQALVDTCLRYLDGDLTEQELQAFNRLLVESPEAADLLAQLSLDEQHYRATPAETEEDLLPELLKLEAAAKPSFETAWYEQSDEGDERSAETYRGTLQVLSDRGFWGYAGRMALRSAPMKWAVGAAAVVLLAVTLVVVFSGGPTTSPQGQGVAGVPNESDPASGSVIVATLTAEQDAVWDQQPGGDVRPGEALYAGTRLTLTQGFAEVTTQRGAIAILEAPATIELIDSDNALYLHSGKLVGLCETDSSKGFLVRTPLADVIDIGTEFGVEVSETQFVSTVYTGEIQVQTLQGESKRLTVDQSASLDLQGTGDRLVVEDVLANRFTRRIPGTTVVASARINSDRHRVEVVPQGVKEDARYYSDRPYEINGVTTDGLPTELLGGDLIRTPASARSTFRQGADDLRIDLELIDLADIYVLHADLPEQNLPEWLTRDYTLTDLRVGLDTTDYPNRVREMQVGPGNGIDQVFRVWKRNQPAVGWVQVAGAMSKHSAYSLVVVRRLSE